MAASIARKIEKTSAPATEELDVEAFHDLRVVAQELNIGNFGMTVAAGRLIITGVATYQVVKDRLWRAVKEYDGWETRIVVDVDVARTDIRGFHTVEPGETLPSIAKLYYGSERRADAIFEANRDRLNDIDQIFPGQQLVIPTR